MSLMKIQVGSTFVEVRGEEEMSKAGIRHRMLLIAKIEEGSGAEKSRHLYNP